MTDKKSSESRRKLLKSIAAGSGAVIAGKNLPENWARPVVDSVMLPAHAQTSGTRTFFLFSEVPFVAFNNELYGTTPEELIARSEQGPLSWFVKPAEAQGANNAICLTIDGSTYQVKYQDGTDFYTGSGAVGGPLKQLDSTCIDASYHEFTVNSVVGSVANVSLIVGKGEPVVIPVPEDSCGRFLFACDVVPD